MRVLPEEDFNKEHVIPEAFGVFEGNFTLIKIVCEKCNKYFGDNLELKFARGSLESIARIEAGVKPPENADSILRNRVSIKYSSNDEVNGLILGLHGDDDQMGILPLPQVRFRTKDDSGWVYIDVFSLEDLTFVIPEEVNLSYFALVADSNVMKKRIGKALKTRDISFTQEYEESIAKRGNGFSWVEITTLVDHIVFRTIAKISFNYFAFIAGREFVLTNEFDQIRNFIRWGFQPRFSIVVPSFDPILRLDTKKYRQTNGHLLTLDWPKLGNHIVSNVSLFDKITYQVLITEYCNKIWRNIRTGHHFNINSKKVERLRVISKHTWPLKPAG